MCVCVCVWGGEPPAGCGRAAVLLRCCCAAVLLNTAQRLLLGAAMKRPQARGSPRPCSVGRSPFMPICVRVRSGRRSRGGGGVVLVYEEPTKPPGAAVIMQAVAPAQAAAGSWQQACSAPELSAPRS